MRLSKIILQNIKSFRARTEIDFGNEMNLFIGPNGGGKSNLMNTISWVLIVVSIDRSIIKYTTIALCFKFKTSLIARLSLTGRSCPNLHISGLSLR
ncbi:MAG: hypothetical protein EOQ95_09700 [Mesorhizobium sp.]|nr:MAG: hypothetical protein EOQ95_09700 [Mesorhizobium sp.]